MILTVLPKGTAFAICFSFPSRTVSCDCSKQMASGNRGLIDIFCKPKVFPFYGRRVDGIGSSAYSCTRRGNADTRTMEKENKLSIV